MPDSAARAEAAFESLHPRLRQWVWRRGWERLNDLQAAAIPAVLGGEGDLIVSAATAGGKTEAVFLPLLSRLMEEGEQGRGVVLYVAPLKALINDQRERLDFMTEDSGITVTPWHGDIGQHVKRAFARRPRGVLAITPESIEAMFVRRGPAVAGIFAHLRHVVIDELHAFIGSERGRQLQSLLHRIEARIGRRIPRAGLSATLGDMGVAAEFLRPGEGEAVRIVSDAGGGARLRLQVRGYEKPAPPRDGPVREEEGASIPERAIAAHLFRTLRGSANLVFANSRSRVERYADLLADACSSLGVPNEFWPHHGSLSKGIREQTETALKSTERPATAVCTSTLEMGIDIGDVRAVAQVGAPFSVAATRQRLGRSGRRGEPAILRAYVIEPTVDERSALPDRLRMGLFQTCAVVDRLLGGDIESPRLGAMHLSTLVQQTLSVIAERGGESAIGLWNGLCREGPFRAVTRETYAALLRQLGAVDFLAQSPDGTLLLGEAGERAVERRDFYAAFQTPDEYALIHRGKVIGRLPTERPLLPGAFIIFGGRRWRIDSVDTSRREVMLSRARGGRVPDFSGSPGAVNDIVRGAMRRLYAEGDVPAYLDAEGRRLFEEGADAFAAAELDTHPLFDASDRTYGFAWQGDIAIDTLSLMLMRRGLQAASEAGVLVIDDSAAAVERALRTLLEEAPDDAVTLARLVQNREVEKYDPLLGDDLLSLEFAARQIDVEAGRAAARELLEPQPGRES